MKRIPLTKGKYSLVDDCDYEYLIQWKWHYDSGYAKRRIYVPITRKLIAVPMQNVVAERMGLDLFYEVDHKNRNKLNNLRHNLRPASQQQQCRNQGLRKDNKSGFRGVYWDKRGCQWAAYIRVNKKAKWIGYFEDKLEAAKAYNKEAKEIFGEFAYLNKV